ANLVLHMGQRTGVSISIKFIANSFRTAERTTTQPLALCVSCHVKPFPTQKPASPPSMAANVLSINAETFPGWFAQPPISPPLQSVPYSDTPETHAHRRTQSRS